MQIIGIFWLIMIANTRPQPFILCALIIGAWKVCLCAESRTSIDPRFYRPTFYAVSILRDPGDSLLISLRSVQEARLEKKSFIFCQQIFPVAARIISILSRIVQVEIGSRCVMLLITIFHCVQIIGTSFEFSVYWIVKYCTLEKRKISCLFIHYGCCFLVWFE